jgi:large subunit ribosomal protein L3
VTATPLSRWASARANPTARPRPSAASVWLTAEIFAADEFVDVTGTTKGRGFQGVVKRYNFGGGRASHGGHWMRKPGSIGMCEFPGRVFKGRKMPGQMGNVRRTVQNLRVIDVKPEDNLLLIKGAIPGPNGRTVIVKEAVKKRKATES